MYDVVTIGSATLDIFVKSSQFKLIKTDEVETGVALCEVYGSKVDVDDVIMTTGGGATNTAVSFARKGLKVATIIEVGKDLGATLVRQDLQEEKVDTQWVVEELEEKTAVSVILTASEGGRSIVTYRGASKMLGEHDIPWEELFEQKQTKWLYVSSLGGKIELLEKLIKRSRDSYYAKASEDKQQIKIAVNPGTGELEETERLKLLVKDIDVFIVNQEEAAKLLNLSFDQESEILSQMKELCSHIVLVTQGEKGAHIITPENDLFSLGAPVKAIQTTGAGDAFGSGFVAGQILGYDLQKSVDLAIANVAGVIQHFGAKEGLITL